MLERYGQEVEHTLLVRVRVRVRVSGLICQNRYEFTPNIVVVAKSSFKFRYYTNYFDQDGSGIINTEY